MTNEEIIDSARALGIDVDSCKSCRDKKDEDRYDAMPKAAWDGVSMLYSKTLDRYFASPEDSEDELEEGQTLSDLRLIVCVPNRAKFLDDSHFVDDLPDDGESPVELLDAIEAFNKALEALPPLSWSPGKFALEIGSEK